MFIIIVEFITILYILYTVYCIVLSSHAVKRKERDLEARMCFVKAAAILDIRVVCELHAEAWLSLCMIGPAEASLLAYY